MKRNAPLMLLQALLMIALSATAVMAMDVNLSWSPVSDTSVQGYKVYYSTTSPDDLTSEPGSPMDVGANTSATLSGLPDGVVYVAVTAYSNTHESPYSSIESNTWMPTQVAPVSGATNVPCDVQFAWSQPPNPDDYSFTVYYGPVGGDMETYAVVPPLADSFTLPTPPLAVTLILSTMLTGLLITSRQRIVRGIIVCSMSALVLSSCGGGGSDSNYTNAVPSDDGGSARAFLDPNTDYQWKVVADNGILQAESVMGTFTTGNQ